MELLNNTVFAALVINLLPQLVILSVIGWVITLIIRKKSAVCRSYVLSSIMISILLITFISMTFQLMDASWGKPLLSISQNQANNAKLESYTPSVISETDNIVSTQAVEYIEKTIPAVNKLSEIENADVNLTTAIVITPFWVNCFGILWLGGFLFVLAKLCYSLVFLRGFKAATLTELDDKFMAILREVSEVFKFKYLPGIFISKAVASPVTIGIKRVSVFIPANLYGNMTEDEFRSILFHEFAHIHHKDHLFSILNKFIIGLNWWNPLVYHISTEQNMAREDVCDDYAIKGIKSAEVYSTCLVNLAERICLISNLPATAGMAGKKSGLEQRIKSIMSKERKMFSKTKKSVKLATVILCVLVVGGVSTSCAVKISIGEKAEKADVITSSNIKRLLKVMPKSLMLDHNKKYSALDKLAKANGFRNRKELSALQMRLVNIKVYLTERKALATAKRYGEKAHSKRIKDFEGRVARSRKKLPNLSLEELELVEKYEKQIIATFAKVAPIKPLAEGQKKLILTEVKFFKKPKINSPLSKCELLLVPKLVTPSGEEGTIRMEKEIFLKEIGKKTAYGFTMTVEPTVNGDNIELKGEVSTLKRPVFQKNEANINSYTTEKKCIIYKLKIKEQDKYYTLGIIQDKENIFEILIKATFINGNGKKLYYTKKAEKVLQKNSKSETAAIKSAKSWLALLDAERYPESWEQAAQVFKKAVTKEQWAKAMAGLKKAFGKNISRKLKSRHYYTSLPGAPDGKYVVIQFKSSFKNKKSAIETITPMLDKDGQWRVSGYFIK